MEDYGIIKSYTYNTESCTIEFENGNLLKIELISNGNASGGRSGVLQREPIGKKMLKFFYVTKRPVTNERLVSLFDGLELSISQHESYEEIPHFIEKENIKEEKEFEYGVRVAILVEGENHYIPIYNCIQVPDKDNPRIKVIYKEA